MNRIYVEPGDEVTTVIERLREVESGDVALIVPRGASLIQSIVNLKLITRAATAANLNLALVTTDKIARTLARQLELPVADDESHAHQVLSGLAAAELAQQESPSVSGVRVHRYYDEIAQGDDEVERSDDEITAEAAVAQEAPQAHLSEETVKDEAPTAPTSPALISVPRELTSPANSDDVPAIERRPVPVSRAIEGIDAPALAAPKRKRRIPAWALWSTAAILVVGGSITTYLAVPTATATVRLPGTAWEQPVTMTATVGLAAGAEDGSSVPAQTNQKAATDTLEFAATGVRKEGTAAKGTVTFSNGSSTSSVTVPAGTRVRAANVIFITDEAVTVPGYTQAGFGQPIVPGVKGAAATAEVVGTEGNVSNTNGSTVTIGSVILTTQVTASGGTSREIKVLTSQDIEKAKNTLRDTLAQKTLTELDAALAGQSIQVTGEDLVDAQIGNPPVNAGAEVATSTISGTVTRTRTFVASADIQLAVEKQLPTLLGSDKSFEVSSVTATSATLNDDRSSAALALTAKGSSFPKIDLKQAVLDHRNASVESFRTDVASLVPGAEVEVVVGPSWWPIQRLPWLASRTTAVLESK